MSIRFCLALLALSSLSAASDPDCNELIKPLEDRTKVAGKWIYHVGATENEDTLKQLHFINSSWIILSPIPDSDDMTLRWADKMNQGNCYTGSSNTTFSGKSTKVTFHFNGTDHHHTGNHLVTCPDCLLWTDTTVIEGKPGASKSLYLFTKTGELDDSHLSVFKKQAACLNLTAGIHFGGNTDLCPEEEMVPIMRLYG